MDLGTSDAPDHFRVYPGYLLVLETEDDIYYTIDPESTNHVYVVSFSYKFKFDKHITNVKIILFINSKNLTFFRKKS